MKLDRAHQELQSGSLWAETIFVLAFPESFPALSRTISNSPDALTSKAEKEIAGHPDRSHCLFLRYARIQTARYFDQCANIRFPNKENETVMLMIWRKSYRFKWNEKTRTWVILSPKPVFSSSKNHHLALPRELTIILGFQNRFPLLAPVLICEELVNQHSCSHTRKIWTNWKWPFLNPSENWGCRTNCHAEIWRDRQIQSYNHNVLT